MAKKRGGTQPTIELRQGDCIAGLQALAAGSVNLLPADPPYNFGHPYPDYNDSRPAQEYLAWTRDWLAAAHRALHKHGAMWLFFPDEWVSYVDVFCRETLKLRRRNWCTWIFSFGQAAQKRFTRSHLHLLYFTKSASQFTFNADALRVPSARQAVYKDKRANGKGKLPDDTWCLLKQDIEYRLPPDGDVWSQARVCGTFKERREHSPNQIPLPIMERIVTATSRPNDLVVDPFLGSGTTAVACLNLKRRFLGFDISAGCIAATQDRLASAQARLADGARQMELPFKAKKAS